MAANLITLAMCLESLGIEGFSLDGDPQNEAEFNAMFSKITGYDDEDMAVFSTDPADFGVTWAQLAAKKTELATAEPMRVLRAERDRRIAETDWWAFQDRQRPSQKQA